MLYLYVTVHGYTRVDGAGRMNPIKIATISLLTIAIVACGGGSPSGATGSSGTDNTNTDTDNTTADVVVIEADLGNGVGSSFVPNVIAVQTTNLSAGGATNLTVSVVDAGNANNYAIAQSYGVRFSSTCTDRSPAKAEFTAEVVSTSSGTASTFYKALGCSGEDIITARLYGEVSSTENGFTVSGNVLAIAVGSVTVELPEVNAVAFTGNSTTALGLSGIANTNLPATGIVSFTVFDNFGNPIEGKEVDFVLSTTSVGATLSAPAGVTDENGVVTAAVNSGTTHGILSITATTTTNVGGTISTSSLPISVTTGSADQNSFNLVVDTLNPRGWDVDGTTVSFSASAADTFQNPVPDGTVINFFSESGRIEPSCETAGGACSVTWTSANPRPGLDLTGALNTNAVGYPGYDATWDGGRAGVATVIAYTNGDAGFADANGNGLLDVGEAYTTMAEAFLDANEDNNFDQADADNPYEKLVDYTVNGVQDAAPVNYQGVACTVAAKTAGHCNELVHVRDQLSFIVASGRATTVTSTGISGRISGDLSAASCINVRNEETVSFSFNVTDSNGNIPPAGTGVTFTSQGFELVGSGPKNVPNAFSTSGVDYTVTIKPDDTFENGFAFFEVTSLDESVSTWSSVELSDDPRILQRTNTFLLDVTSSDQTVTYSFRDACGNVPAAADIILFDMENALIGTGGTGNNKLQISGANLTAGNYTITYTDDGTSSTGNIVVSTINSVDGTRVDTSYEIDD
jgi:Bacterial Ig-like domain (group 1)